MTERAQIELRSIPIDRITPSPHQPRRSIDRQRLFELSESIRRSGVLQPIRVRPAGAGYEIIAGERRWRAARDAGLTEIPAIVVTASASMMNHRVDCGRRSTIHLIRSRT